MMVVLVLITSCHVVENSKNGPLTAQMRIRQKAMTDATGRPEMRATAFDNLLKKK